MTDASNLSDKSKKRIAQGILLGISLLISLGILELGIRIFVSKTTSSSDRVWGFMIPSHLRFDSITGFSLIPNMSDEGRRIHTDENGFRKTSRNYDPNLPTIAVAGDSVVFGYGVQDTDAYAYKLSQDPRFKNYNIVNAGVPSYSIGNITAVMKRKLKKFHPKVTLVSILWPWKAFEAFEIYGPGKDSWKKINFEFFKKTMKPEDTHFEPETKTGGMHWATADFIRTLYKRVRYKKELLNMMSRPQPYRDGFSLPVEEETRIAQEHVQELRDAAKELGGTVIFYIHPFQYVLFNPDYKDFGKLGRDIFAKELGAIDLGKVLKEGFKGEPLFFDVCHLTPEGNRMAADYFGDVIEKTLGRGKLASNSTDL